MAWKLACMLRTYKTYNSTVGFSKYEFYNTLLGSVTLVRVTSSITWTQPIYIYNDGKKGTQQLNTKVSGRHKQRDRGTQQHYHRPEKNGSDTILAIKSFDCFKWRF